MGNKKKGKKAKGGGDTQSMRQEEEFKKAPHTFVINRGHVGKNVNELITDMRRVMEPYTASSLKTRKKNVLKDFVSIAGALNVSHMLMFSKTETSTNLRIVRLPRGPTLTFQVNSFSLCKDVISTIKRHNMEPKQFKHHPLLVMNNFSGEGMHMKLMASMFQNMFPSLNINTVKLNSIRRCVLLNYNQEDQTIEFRHYNIRVVPVGLSKGVKKLIKATVPNLGKYDDVSEYVLRGGNLSESEAELDGPHNEITLPQSMSGRGNIKAAQSAIRLTEIGPRMTLRLVKIEEGVCSGEVMFHEFIKKTAKELQALKVLREKKRKLKLKRKQEQEARVRKKEDEKEEHKKKCMSGMKDEEEKGEDKEEEDEEVEDIEYYKQEVGTAPDPDLFPTSGRKRKRPSQKETLSPKKAKFDKHAKVDGKERRFEKSKSKNVSFTKTGSTKKRTFDNENRNSKFGKKVGKDHGTKRFDTRQSRKPTRGGKSHFGAKSKKFQNKNKKRRRK